MLSFIHNQTKQYEAYTDRYFAFKIKFRELIPYRKKIEDNINIQKTKCEIEK